MKKYLLLIICFYLTLQIKSQIVTDVDGNSYNTVTIGSQVWMKENLKTTKYNDGTAIPNVTDNNNWAALTTGAYCNYNNLSSNVSTYGRLYNYYAVIDEHKLCLSGWHVPSYAEWTILINTLGDSVAAGKMKTTSHDWRTPNEGATNESGFSALPAGARYETGLFYPSGVGAYFLSSTELSADFAYDVQLHYNSSEDEGNGCTKTSGFSVRCLKDGSTNLINTISKQTDRYIYPNPANDILHFKNTESPRVQLIIYDLQGKEVISREIGSNYMDISSLSKGIYIVRIVDSGNIVFCKLIKE